LFVLAGSYQSLSPRHHNYLLGRTNTPPSSQSPNAKVHAAMAVASASASDEANGMATAQNHNNNEHDVCNQQNTPKVAYTLVKHYLAKCSFEKIFNLDGISKFKE